MSSLFKALSGNRHPRYTRVAIGIIMGASDKDISAAMGTDAINGFIICECIFVGP